MKIEVYQLDTYKVQLEDLKKKYFEVKALEPEVLLDWPQSLSTRFLAFLEICNKFIFRSGWLMSEIKKNNG